jgi:hypothetical protein
MEGGGSLHGNRAVAAVVLRIVTLQVVECGVAGHVADHEAVLAVRQFGELDRNSDGRVATPARAGLVHHPGKAVLIH